MVDACDFCGDPSPVVSYPCADFVVRSTGGTPLLQLGSRAGWAACEGCAALIDQDDRTGLTERALQQLSWKYGWDLSPKTHQEMYATINNLHRLFFERRLGGPRPLGARN